MRFTLSLLVLAAGSLLATVAPPARVVATALPAAPAAGCPAAAAAAAPSSAASAAHVTDAQAAGNKKMGEVTPPTFKKPGPVEVAPPAEIKKPQVAPPALEKKDGGVGGSGEAAAEGSDGKKMGEVTPPAFKKPGPVKVAPPTEVKKPQIAPPELEKKEGGRGGYEA